MSGGESPAKAQDESVFVLRVGTTAPEGDTPWGRQLEAFKAHVEEASRGRIQVKVRRGGAIATDAAVAAQIDAGTLEAYAGSTSALVGQVPELELLEAPFVFDDARAVDRALDGPARPLVSALLARRGLHFSMWFEKGFRHWLTRATAVGTPSEMHGLRVRIGTPTAPSPLAAEALRALGAEPVPVDDSTLREALAANRLDGFEATLVEAHQAAWYVGCEHLTLSRHAYDAGVLAIAKSWYDRLPPDLRRVLDEVPAAITDRARRDVRRLETALIASLERHRLQPRRLDAEERAAFAATVEPLVDRRAAALGPAGRRLLRALRGR
jgi:TRAP-type C4-dicarboxylate transport system substrate-binding protein